jgi:hypothetical protein
MAKVEGLSVKMGLSTVDDFGEDMGNESTGVTFEALVIVSPFSLLSSIFIMVRGLEDALMRG